jgi:hypothetical protein
MKVRINSFEQDKRTGKEREKKGRDDLSRKGLKTNRFEMLVNNTEACRQVNASKESDREREREREREKRGGEKEEEKVTVSGRSFWY